MHGVSGRRAGSRVRKRQRDTAHRDHQLCGGMHASPFPHLPRDRGRGSWVVGRRRPAFIHLAPGELDGRDGAGREGGRQDRAFLTWSLALTDAVPPRRTVLDKALPLHIIGNILVTLMCPRTLTI